MNPTGYAQVLEELPSVGGTPSVTYTIGDDILDQATTTSGTEFTTRRLVYDGHGSTRQLVSGGTTVSVNEQYNYDAYGVGVAPPESPGTSLLYAGEQFDSVLKQYYLRARYYDPSNGRFNQRDPARPDNFDPQSLHKYDYCQGDPTDRLDPSGQFSLAGVLAVVAVIAVLAFITFRIGFNTQYGDLKADILNYRKKGQERLMAEKSNYLAKNTETQTYDQDVLSFIIDAFTVNYPAITSEACGAAEGRLEQYFLQLFTYLTAFDAESVAGGVRRSILYESGALRKTGPNLGPYNVLILLPREYKDSVKDDIGPAWTNHELANATWHGSDAKKKGIIMLNPASAPIVGGSPLPIYYLYDAVFAPGTPFGPFKSLSVWPISGVE
jgi:RHS repeat-associated protein